MACRAGSRFEEGQSQRSSPNLKENQAGMRLSCGLTDENTRRNLHRQRRAHSVRMGGCRCSARNLWTAVERAAFWARDARSFRRGSHAATFHQSERHPLLRWTHGAAHVDRLRVFPVVHADCWLCGGKEPDGASSHSSGARCPAIGGGTWLSFSHSSGIHDAFSRQPPRRGVREHFCDGWVSWQAIRGVIAG